MELIRMLMNKKYIAITIFFILIFHYIFSSTFSFLDDILKFLVLILTILISINFSCIIYVFNKEKVLIKNSSILSLLSSFLGFFSVQSCVAGVCNPGIIASLLIPIFPSLAYFLLDFTKYLIFISIFLIFYSLNSMKCFKESNYFRVRRLIKS